MRLAYVQAVSALETLKGNDMTKANTKTATTTVTGHYTATLAKWPVKLAGAKPTAGQFKTAHEMGVRPGTKTAVAIAMMLRPKGATQAEITAINGGAYLNKARDLIAAKRAKREAVPQTPDGHTVYKLALTSAKPAAKRKGKGKATAKPAATETTATA